MWGRIFGKVGGSANFAKDTAVAYYVASVEAGWGWVAN